MDGYYKKYFVADQTESAGRYEQLELDDVKGHRRHWRRRKEDKRNGRDRSRDHSALQQETSFASLYPNRKFGFRNLLGAHPEILRRIPQMQDGCPLPHQRPALENPDPAKDIGG